MTKKDLILKIEKERKSMLKDCWDYHSSLLAQEGIKKVCLEDELFNLELNDWEDVGFFVGYLRGLDYAQELVEKNIK